MQRCGRRLGSSGRSARKRETGNTRKTERERGREGRNGGGSEGGLVEEGRQSQCTAGECNAPRQPTQSVSTTSERILPHFKTTASSLVTVTIRDYVFFCRCLFHEFPLLRILANFARLMRENFYGERGRGRKRELFAIYLELGRYFDGRIFFAFILSMIRQRLLLSAHTQRNETMDKSIR